MGDSLTAQLRLGQINTSYGVVDFVAPDLYELCEKESVYYIIHLKKNFVLQKIGEKIYSSFQIKDVTDSEKNYEESEYHVASWKKYCKVIV